MKTKNMNSTNTEFLSWADVDRAIGEEARKDLQPKLKHAKRIRGVAGIIGVGALAALVGVILFFLFGCGTPQGRTTYTTLASTELAAKSSYDGYLDSVLQGQTRTNEVPLIAATFNEFQAAMAIAVTAASGDTNALVTADIAAKSAKLIQQINAAKGKK